mgnify:CR=1 FL=1
MRASASSVPAFRPTGFSTLQRERNVRRQSSWTKASDSLTAEVRTGYPAPSRTYPRISSVCSNADRRSSAISPAAVLSPMRRSVAASGTIPLVDVAEERQATVVVLSRQADEETLSIVRLARRRQPAQQLPSTTCARGGHS